MTRRANPKPRWLRYEGKDGKPVNERADDKAERMAAHRRTVKLQQAAGLEFQSRRKEIERREVIDKRTGKRVRTSLGDHDTLKKLGREWLDRQLAA